MTTYIVHDAITGHPIGLASQSLLQAHLKLLESVPGSVPTFIAASNRVCGGMEVYELDDSNGTKQWPRRRAVQLMELPDPVFNGGGNWASDPELPVSSAMRDLAGTVRKALGVEVSPWSWPTLPPGHSYLNPENLTVEQLGDGWRPLCTLDEKFPADHEMLSGSGWDKAYPCSFARPDDSFDLTYRTRAPIPTLLDNP